MSALVPSPTSPVSCGRKADGRTGRGEGEVYLNSGNEGSGEVGTETRGQGQLVNVLVFSKGAGDGLLAQQLETGHAVLHTNHIQRWSGRHKQPGVPMAPTDGDDGALPKKEGTGGGAQLALSQQDKVSCRF